MTEPTRDEWSRAERAADRMVSGYGVARAAWVTGYAQALADARAAPRQRELFAMAPAGQPVTPASNDDTSLAAAFHQRRSGKARRDRERVLAALRARPDTADGICERLGLGHQTGSARVSGLKSAGAIRDSGARRYTRSGRLAIVWEVVT